jgi:hypothetical protein
MAVELDGIWWLEIPEVMELEGISRMEAYNRMAAWTPPDGPATGDQYYVWREKRDLRFNSRATRGRLIDSRFLSPDAQRCWKQRMLKAVASCQLPVASDQLPVASASASYPEPARSNPGRKRPDQDRPTGIPASSAQLRMWPQTERDRAIALVKASLPDAQARACIQRFKYIEPLVNHDFASLGFKTKIDFLRERSRDAGVSINTLLRWHTKYTQFGEIKALGNESPGPPAGTGGVLDCSMKAHIQKCWEILKLTKAQTWQSLENYLKEKQRGCGARYIYEVPHRTTVERYINDVLQGDLDALRAGPDMLHAYAGYMDRTYTDLASLERVEVDEWKMDALGYEDKHPKIVRRFWLLTFYDARALYPLVWHLVQGSEYELRHGIGEADEINLMTALIREYGVPEAINSDRGRFRGKIFGGKPLGQIIDERFQRADGILDQLGIRHNTPRVHNPRGNRLERFHRFLADECRKVPGWIGANTKQRKMAPGDEQRAAHLAPLDSEEAPGRVQHNEHILWLDGQRRTTPLLSRSQLLEHVNGWMDAWREHSSEGTDMHGLSPRAVFVHNTPVGGFKRIPDEQLAIATAEHYKDETIALGGIIELPDGTRYSHPLLTEYVGECREVIRLRYDHSRISVLPDQKGEEIIVAPRRVRVGTNDQAELARQSEMHGKVKNLIAGFAAPRAGVRESGVGSRESEHGEPAISSTEFVGERMGLNRESGVGARPGVPVHEEAMDEHEDLPMPSFYELKDITAEES